MTDIKDDHNLCERLKYNGETIPLRDGKFLEKKAKEGNEGNLILLTRKEFNQHITSQAKDHGHVYFKDAEKIKAFFINSEYFYRKEDIELLSIRFLPWSGWKRDESQETEITCPDKTKFFKSRETKFFNESREKMGNSNLNHDLKINYYSI